MSTDVCVCVLCERVCVCVCVLYRPEEDIFLLSALF